MVLLPRQQLRLALWFALTGALSFWLPDVVIHIAYGNSFDSPQVRVITFLLPATFLCAYVAAHKFAARRNFSWLGAAMLLGVWLTGGLFTALAATTANGGFAGPDGFWGGVLFALLGALPPATFIMATYDGSLFALLAITVGVPMFFAISLSGLPLPFRRFPK